MAIVRRIPLFLLIVSGSIILCFFFLWGDQSFKQTYAQSALDIGQEAQLLCEEPYTGRHPYRVFDEISGIYCAYNIGFEVNPLGLPTSNKIEIDNSGNFVQYFDNGQIYLHGVERAAFALFNDILDTYIAAGGPNSSFGFPISSQIGGPGDCRAYFEKGYIHCNGATRAWNSDSRFRPDHPETHDLPIMELPFDNGYSTYFTGGPHAFGHPFEFGNSSIALAESAGMDFQNLSNNYVAAMTGGTVIDVDASSPFAPSHIAIRSDFSGVVIVYGHVSADPGIEPGKYVEQGMKIGTEGSSPVHAHIELRDGTRCEEDTFDCKFGKPVDWDGISVDNYLFSAFRTTENGNIIHHYDGVALKRTNLFWLDSHRKYSLSQLQSALSNTSFTYTDCQFLDNDGQETAYTWTTTAADNGRCDNGSYDEGRIVYAMGALNQAVGEQLLGQLNLSQPVLFSSNTVIPYVPRHTVPSDDGSSTPTPQPGSCPTDGRDGIYFYKDQDYQGTCFFSRDDVSDFGTTPIGDNALSSLEIIGNWKVLLYEDINYSGRYDIHHDSNPNLDINSLGDQYSSAKITDTTVTCPTDGREGVYMYSNRNYDGRCLFATQDVPDFGATILEDNDLSSIRFIGNWETKIYEDVNYGGRYDVIGSNDPDLDIRSLGGQYSSIEIQSIIVPPTNTPTPSPTPAPISTILLSPSINNGGFELGNISGWQQSGGTFDIDTENPHSGQYYVKGTNAEQASFYRSFSLADYHDDIDAGLGSAFFSTWIDIGKSENYRYVVKFTAQNGGELWRFDTGWTYHAGGYTEIAGNIPSIPVGSASVVVEASARRTGGSYTDADFDDFSLTLQFASAPPPTETPTPSPTTTPSPTATPIPDCSTYSFGGVTLFDATQCNPTFERLLYPTIQTLTNLSDLAWDDRVSSIHVAPGWSVMTFELNDAQGARRCLNSSMWDLSVDYFDGIVNMDNEISSIVAYDRPDCPAFETSGLYYDVNPLVGDSTSVSFEILNVSGRSITLRDLFVEVHGPGCPVWDCPNIMGFPWSYDITLAPGESHSFTAKRAFNIPDPEYLMRVFSSEPNGWWYAHTPELQFSVNRGIEVIQPLTISPTEPLLGQPVTAEYTIQNVGDRPITVAQLGVLARGPDCIDWNCEGGWADFPSITDVTILPGNTYTYRETRIFEIDGNGYFADAVFADVNQWWYLLPNNQRVYFSVTPVLQVLEPLSLNKSTIPIGQPVTARYTVQNVSGRTLTFKWIGVGVHHAPSCPEWGCGWTSDFPWEENVTLLPDQIFTYERERAFYLPDHEYLIQPLTLDDKDIWRSHGAIETLPVLPGVEIIQSLVLSPSTPTVGQNVTAHYEIQNTSAQTITLPWLGVVARGPNCIDWSCEHGWADFPRLEGVVLSPGESRAYLESRSFDNTGEGYLADAAYADNNDWWYTFYNGERVYFSISPNAERGVIQSKVSLQGRQDHEGVTVSAWYSAVDRYTTMSSASGNFTLTVPSHVYTVTVEVDRYLDAEQTNVSLLPGETVVLPGITLLGGDANDEDVVNILDLSLMGGRYGAVCGDPGWDVRADINNDCTVNILDLSLAGGNYGRTSPIPWP